MASDKNLINASFNLSTAQAKVEYPDLTNVYKANIDVSRQYMGIITNVLGELKKERDNQRIGKEKQLENLKRSIDAGFKKIYSQKEPMPMKVVQAVRDEIKKLQADFEEVNTFGDDDNELNAEARMRIEGQLNRVINAAVNFREQTMNLKTRVENVRVDDVDGKVINPMTLMLDLDNMDTNDDVGVKFMDGDLKVYAQNYNTDYVRVLNPDPTSKLRFLTQKQKSGEVVGMTIDEMSNALPQYDADKLKNVIANINDYSTLGAADAKLEAPVNSFENPDFYSSEKTRFINTHIKDKGDFQNLASSMIVGASFKDALYDRIDIATEVLSNMFLSDTGERSPLSDVFATLDRNRDGSINMKDAKGLQGESKEKFKQNFNLMVEVLTNTTHKAFDLKRSSDLLADYYMGIGKNNYQRNYDAVINKNVDKGLEPWVGSGKSLRAQGIGGSGYIEYYDGLNMYNSAKEAMNGKETSFTVNNYKYSYNPATGTWSGETLKQPVPTHVLFGKQTGFKISHHDFDMFRVKPKKKVLNIEEIKLSNNISDLTKRKSTIIFMLGDENWQKENYPTATNDKEARDMAMAEVAEINKKIKELQ